jgi:hypothetical protein
MSSSLLTFPFFPGLPNQIAENRGALAGTWTFGFNLLPPPSVASEYICPSRAQDLGFLV